MPVLTKDQFIQFLRDFVALQSAFFSENPLIHDWQDLVGSPRHGEIHVAGLTWKFARHGKGLMFTSESGVVIDIHEHIRERGIIDAHRMNEFILSLGKTTCDEDCYEKCSLALTKLEPLGIITRVGSRKGVWRLL